MRSIPQVISSALLLFLSCVTTTVRCGTDASKPKAGIYLQRGRRRALQALVPPTRPVIKAPIKAPAKAPVKRPMSAPAPVGRIAELTLVNANTDRRIVKLVNGTVIALGDLVGMLEPSFNVNASVAGTVQSVKFAYQQITTRIENGTAPNAIYAFCGRNGLDFFKCNRLGIGNHIVTATPYGLTGGRGQAGTPVTVSFSMIRGKLTQRDPVAPRLINLSPIGSSSSTLVSATITNDVVRVGLRLQVQDDVAGVRSGFKAGYVTALDPVSLDVVSNESFAPNRLDAPVAGQPLSFSINLTFVESVRTGQYPLQVYLSDIVNNVVIIKADDLRKRSFPSSISIFNPGFDDTAPRLISFLARTPTTVNAASGGTNGGASVRFTVTVQDDKSGFAEGYIQAYDPEDVVSFFEAPFRSDVPVAGRPVTFNVTMSVPSNIKAAKYSLDILLIDARDNLVYVYSEELAELKFTSSLDVVNPAFDKTPPEVLNVKALSATTVDVATKDAVVILQVSTRDAASGVAMGKVQVFDPLFAATEYPFSFNPPVVGRTVSTNVTLSFARSTTAGNYSLQLVVEDASKNRNILMTRDLVRLKYPSVVRVVN